MRLPGCWNVALLALGLTSIGVVAPGCQSDARAAPGPVPTAPPPAVASPQRPADERVVAPQPSLAPLVKQLRPSVVNIYTTQNVRPRRLPPRFRGGPEGHDDPQDLFEHFFGGRLPQRETKRSALGSGFLVGNGQAITNHHVIDGADEIKVKLADGRGFDAKVVGRDPSTDVALLELMGEGAKALPSVRLGDSDALEVGDYVVAIGNPFGLSLTVTSGIVSAKERVIDAGPYDDFIQTDASINPGNSGGPLFNLKGEVVGVNTAIAAQGQGIGFAVPVNMVKELLPQLQASGRVARGWLGVGIQEITPELARTFGIASGHGALIAQVFPNGPAAAAGLQSGDVVVEFNGRAIDAPGALTRAVAATKPGGTAKLKVLRDRSEKTFEVKVAERDDGETGPVGDNGGGQEPSAGAVVGLSVTPLTPDLARRMGVSEGDGLVVGDVAQGSAAEIAGVRPGDLLLDLQQKPVPTLDAYRKLARTVKPGDTVVFRVRRGGSALFLAAQAPGRK